MTSARGFACALVVLFSMVGCAFRSHTQPAPLCGNGIPEVGEECDDGDHDDTDTCLASCVLHDCADGPDADADGAPDRCDACEGVDDHAADGDPDGDRICGLDDNCPRVSNLDQLDADLDGVGDGCEILDDRRIHWLTAADASTLERVGDRLGASLAAGDFDGDGMDELVAGAPRDDGRAFIVVWSRFARRFGDAVVLRPSTMLAPAGWGRTLAVGDFDGNRRDELVVAAPGSVEAPDTLWIWKLGRGGEWRRSEVSASELGCGAHEAADDFGVAIAVGDLSGDGLDDLVVGIPGHDDSAGAVCVIRGSAAGIVHGSGIVLSQDAFHESDNDIADAAPGDRFGAALVTGAFSRGNTRELAVGVPGEDYEQSKIRDAGAVWVLRADATQGGSSYAIDVLLSQEPVATNETDDAFGTALAAGDLNADGLDDLFVGAPQKHRTLEESSVRGGALFVIDGGADGLQADSMHARLRDLPSFVASESPAEHDAFGSMLATGDFDNDGFLDLWGGAPGRFHGAGALAVHPGAEDASERVGEHLTLASFGRPPVDQASLGAATIVGDFDGNGVDDIALAAPGMDDERGAVVMLQGNDWNAASQKMHFDSEPGVWRLIVIPDTQGVVEERSPILDAQIGWITHAASTLDVRFVIHEGDICEWAHPTEWEFAARALQRLSGVVPFVLVPGNHDYGANGSADVRQSLMDDYFSFTDFGTFQTLGGQYDQTLWNTYHYFSVGAERWIVLGLEFGPRDEVVEWAGRVLSAHPDRHAVIVTHAYLYNDDTRYDAVHRPDQRFNPIDYGLGIEGVQDGEALWMNLVSQHANVRFVLSGHVLGDGTGHLSSNGNAGNVVHQLVANYQTMREGGLGYLRVMEFRPMERRVDVFTYSPWLNSFRADPENEFSLPL